jgi:hypothetical protein
MSNRSPAGDPTGVLAAHWDESERRLYPVATTNPDAYQSAVRLVRAVADALAGVEDLDALAERWEHRSELVDEALRVTGDIAGYRLPEPEIAGSAFAIRRRELLAEQAERGRRNRIAAARQASQAWAVIHEQGDLDSGLLDPYQRIELHLATGLAVVSTVEPDPSTMAPIYVVMVAALGDEQGRIADLDAASFGDVETGDRELFEDHRLTMKSRIEAAGA